KMGFSVLNGVRAASGANGKYSKRKIPYPEKDVRHIKYYFDQEVCKDCKLYKQCYLNKQDYPLEVDLLSILGINTFLRRIGSLARKEPGLDKDFVDTIPCYAGWTFSRITTEGDVKPCCKSGFTLGNIKTKRFSDIFFSAEYEEFRQNCKCLPKKDEYFLKTNCHNICDNLGANLMVHRDLLNHLKRADNQQLPSVNYFKNKISIPARSFIRGNLNRSSDIFGSGMVIDGGAGFGYAEYLIKIEQDDCYEIWLSYASEIPRPIELKIDKNYVAKIAKSTTGGWSRKHLKLSKEHEYYFEKGTHSIELFSSLYIPHIEKIELRTKPKTEAKIICDHSSVYPRRIPFNILKESLAAHGIKLTLKRAVKFLKPSNLFENILDIAGIFDGEYAYKGPFHVQIDLTNNCNNNCIGCWCNSPLLGEKSMPADLKSQYIPFQTAKDLLNEIKAMGAKEVYYSGSGEPFMHPQIMEILEYTKKLNLSCYVNTNFTLLDKSKIDKIIELGIDHMTVSVWAGTAKTYSQTHPNKTEQDFDRIKENLCYLNRNKKNRPLIKIYEVIFNMNYQELNQMIEFARQTESESVEFTLIDTMPGKTDKLALSLQEQEILYREARDVGNVLGQNFSYKGVHLFRFDQFLRRLSRNRDVAEAKYDRNIIESMPCYIGWLFCRILPDGNVNTCLKSHRFPVGNIYENKFSKIWNSEKQILCRKKMLSYKKDDPFFGLIGNDPETKEAGCYKSCDDIGRNLHMHKKIMSLTKPQIAFIKILAKYKKMRIKKSDSNRSKISAPSINKIILGIKDSRAAYQGPEHVVMDLTNRCQLRCNACWLYSQHLKQNKPSSSWLQQELPYPAAEAFIKDAADMGLAILRFTGGGEPLLYGKIFELMEISKSKNIRTCLTTNFFGLDRDKIKNIAGLKLNEITISLWAPDAKTYIKIHPGTKKEDFLNISENLSYLNSIKSKDTKVTIANVITSDNFDTILDMGKFAERVLADALYFTFADTFKDETDFLLLNKQQLAQLKSDFKAMQSCISGSGIEIENLSGFVSRLESDSSQGYYDKSRIDTIPCYVGWFFARIMPNGNIVPCCRGVDYPMGNIIEKSLPEIWYSEKYNGFRHRAKYFKKDNPYFAQMNCYKECDNFMHNEHMHKILSQKYS
ncbi:MAG: radical SAM protein, partial [Candidatus Omnitrophica bacterium]|nr:radical SAM protein [Candidatus Omnitrophota bacterium]